jgi:hypothetical protein
VPARSLVSLRAKGLAPPTVFSVAGNELPAAALKSRRSWMLMTERFRRPDQPTFEILAGEAAKNARVDLFVWSDGDETTPR